MLEDDEVQRKELSRLLGTAKDKDRQELILKAISALDEQEKLTSVQEVGMYKQHSFLGMNPSMHASLFMGENMPVLESVTLTPGGSSRMRPMSARRRPSVPNLLDAIPEAAPRTQLVNRNEEIVLPIEDIAEVVASSYDRRFPPKNVFRHSSNLNGAAGGPNAHSQGPHRSSEFNSIANSSGGAVPEYTTASALGGYGAYTPELNMINANSNSNGAQYPHILSASTSTSSLGGAPSSSSGAGGGGSTQVVVPVAQRRMSNRSSSSLGGTGGELHGKPGFSNQPKGWICAAIVPSFLHVSFFEKWEIKKIEVYCSGIERLCVQICASAAAAMKPSSNATEMVHLGKGTFVWSAGGSEDTFESNVGGLPGLSVTFLLRGASSCFVHISEIRIIVHPYT